MARLRTLFMVVVAYFALGATLPAFAEDWKPFEPAAFAEAQKGGKSILIDVFAVWCPTCRAQNPILVQLTRDPKYKDLGVFKADFERGRTRFGP